MIRRDFDSSFSSLRRAEAWAQATLRTHGVSPGEFHYALESTACYHFPILHAWGGKATVINPSHAKLGSRKTDQLADDE